jgi:hypothetical protein
MTKNSGNGDFVLQIKAALTDSTHYNLTVATDGTTQVCFVQYSRLFFDKTQVETIQQYFFDVGTITATDSGQDNWPNFVYWTSSNFFIGLTQFYFSSGASPSFAQQIASPWNLISSSGYMELSFAYFNFRVRSCISPNIYYRLVDQMCY